MVVSRRTLLLCHHHHIVLGAVAAKRLCSTSQPVSFETSLWVEQPSKVNWDAQFKMAKEELPAVFHMKPLNNWPNETKIMNNVCRCQCHTFEQKEDWWQNLKHTMIVKVKKKRVLMAIIGLSCFIFGLAIPLLFIGNSFSTSEPASTERPSFASLVHFRNRERHHVDSAVVNTTLDNVFISVKTTKQYHYPRVIIQLETWVSLVKSQVSFSFCRKKTGYGWEMNCILFRPGSSPIHTMLTWWSAPMATWSPPTAQKVIPEWHWHARWVPNSTHSSSLINRKNMKPIWTALKTILF